MSDRLVRNVSPALTSDEPLKSFSTYLHFPNIVLLGDPGAGKSHLFHEFALATGGVELRARDFLNSEGPSLGVGKTLFIDGLDEKRAGHGDHNTIDEIVRKLIALRPDKVRIACRAVDWLGETDLAAFQTYFDLSGQSVVLNLEPLSDEERLELLRATEISEPSKFLEEATRRGLEGMLTNPQNLIMLSAVVKRRSWPKSRKELFQQSVEILLSEHSLAQTRKESGGYQPDELLEPAGCLCALRLVSDIDGFCTADTSQREELPSYRRITMCNPSKGRAVLGRRVFRAGSITETVDYTHRTVAEYLAAHWIARKVRSGLPIGRVQSLICIEGRPASELRGLHAWLPIFLPEHANRLISGDPFGVLCYGDAASLQSGDRNSLIRALADLAKSDPWFRAGNWSSYAVAALSGHDMVVSFREILNDPLAGSHLRSIVLDAMVTGAPLAELQPQLLTMLTNGALAYSERVRSLEALVNLGKPGKDAVWHSYQSIGSSGDDLGLKAEIAQRLRTEYLSVGDLVELLRAALRTKVAIAGNAIWALHEAIAESDIVEILDRLSLTQSSNQKVLNSGGAVVYVFDRLIDRLLRSFVVIPEDKLWRWLQFRAQHATHGEDRSSVELRRALSDDRDVAARLVDAGIRALMVDSRSWGFLHNLREIGLHQLQNNLILERICRSLEQQPRDKEKFLYEVAFGITFQSKEGGVSFFELLEKYAEGDPELEAIRAKCCFIEIPDWKIVENRRRKEYEISTIARIAVNREEFVKCKEQIRNGTDLKWLGFIGEIYFCMFSDLDEQLEPEERLIIELGDENAQIALDGMVALVEKRIFPSVQEVAQKGVKNLRCRWWYALIAGLDHYIKSGHSIRSLSDENIRAMVAMDTTHTTFRYKKNVSRQIEYGWKKDLLENYPQLVVDSYLELARAGLAAQATHVNGLYEMLHVEALKAFRADAALKLLGEYPKAPAQSLSHLLPAALQGAETEELLEVLRVALGACNTPELEDSYALILATGYLLNPNEFRGVIEQLSPISSREVIWALRDCSGFRRGRRTGTNAFSIEQLEFIVRMAASHFVRVEHPAGGWSGDRNPWDAAEFIQNMIVAVSADPSMAATDALARLAASAELGSYLDHVKHSAAEQGIRRIDAEFRQPSWKEVQDVLSNGSPVCVADLYALVLSHLIDLGPQIASSNTDIYKRFWNEDQYGRVTEPKVEESCRDVLVELLRVRLNEFGISVEPEGHMASDKRADIVATLPRMKVVIELKRDCNSDVWTAIQKQLDRFYTRDPDAHGFGIYGVFWYGSKGKVPIPNPPPPLAAPLSASDLQGKLTSLIAPAKIGKISVVAIDVSGEIP